MPPDSWFCFEPWPGHIFLQVAVALMRRMEDRFGRSMDAASEHMAETLIRAWMVGGVSCQVGFLILYVQEGHKVLYC